MPDSLEVAVGKLEQAVKNLGEREAEHHSTILAEIKDVRENLNPRLTALEHGYFSKTDFVSFRNSLVVEQKTQDDRIDALEKSAERRKGSWSTLQVLGTLAAFIIGSILTWLAIR